MKKWLLGAAILFVFSPCLLAQSTQIPPRPLPEPPNVFPTKAEPPQPPTLAPAPQAQSSTPPIPSRRRAAPRVTPPPRPNLLTQCQEENAKLRTENTDLRERLSRAEGERDGLRNSLERLGPCVAANTALALTDGRGGGLRRALGDWWSWLVALLGFLLGLLLGHFIGTRGQPKKKITRKHRFEKYGFTLTGTERDEARKRWIGIYRCSCGTGEIRDEQGIEEHLRGQHTRGGDSDLI